MSTHKPTLKSDIIPLSEAVTLVSYSRDYIGRLAREGKIAASQIDREWFVSRQSLLNFFETSSLEESAKKKILSLSRKNDLEVKDFYTKRLESISARKSQLHTAGVLGTLAIMVGGLVSGYVFYTNAQVIVFSSPEKVVEIVQALTLVPPSSQVATVAQVLPGTQAQFRDGLVIESNEAIAMDKGIVLFPTLKARDGETVAELFSDDVTVVVTSTTTGFIRSADGSSELPFVRVPNGTSF